MSSWPLELRRAGRGDMECDPLRHFPTVVAFEEYIKQRLLYPGTSILAIEQTHVSEPRFFTNFFPSAITILKSNKIARDLLLVSPTSALGASIIGNLSHTDQSNQPHLLGILLLGDNLVNPNPTPYPPTMRPSHPSPAPINPQPVAITCGPMPNPSTLKQSESSSDPLPDRPSQLPSKRPNDNDMEEEGAPAQSKARLSSEPDTRDGDSKATESHDPGPTLPKPIAIKQEKTDGTDEHSPIRTMKLLGNTSNLSVTTRVIPLKMPSSGMGFLPASAVHGQPINDPLQLYSKLPPQVRGLRATSFKKALRGDDVMVLAVQVDARDASNIVPLSFSRGVHLFIPSTRLPARHQMVFVTRTSERFAVVRDFIKDHIGSGFEGCVNESIVGCLLMGPNMMDEIIAPVTPVQSPINSSSQEGEKEPHAHSFSTPQQHEGGASGGQEATAPPNKVASPRSTHLPPAATIRLYYGGNDVAITMKLLTPSQHQDVITMPTLPPTASAQATVEDLTDHKANGMVRFSTDILLRIQSGAVNVLEVEDLADKASWKKVAGHTIQLFLHFTVPDKQLVLVPGTTPLSKLIKYLVDPVSGAVDSEKALVLMGPDLVVDSRAGSGGERSRALLPAGGSGSDGDVMRSDPSSTFSLSTVGFKRFVIGKNRKNKGFQVKVRVLQLAIGASGAVLDSFPPIVNWGQHLPNPFSYSYSSYNGTKYLSLEFLCNRQASVLAVHDSPGGTGILNGPVIGLLHDHRRGVMSHQEMVLITKRSSKKDYPSLFQALFHCYEKKVGAVDPLVEGALVGFLLVGPNLVKTVTTPPESQLRAVKPEASTISPPSSLPSTAVSAQQKEVASKAVTPPKVKPTMGFPYFQRNKSARGGPATQEMMLYPKHEYRGAPGNVTMTLVKKAQSTASSSAPPMTFLPSSATCDLVVKDPLNICDPIRPFEEAIITLSFLTALEEGATIFAAQGGKYSCSLLSGAIYLLRPREPLSESQDQLVFVSVGTSLFEGVHSIYKEKIRVALGTSDYHKTVIGLLLQGRGLVSVIDKNDQTARTAKTPTRCCPGGPMCFRSYYLPCIRTHQVPGPRPSLPSISGPYGSFSSLPPLKRKAESSGQREGSAGKQAKTTRSSPSSQVLKAPSPPPPKKTAVERPYGSSPSSSPLDAAAIQKTRLLGRESSHGGHKAIDQSQRQQGVTGGKKMVMGGVDLGSAQKDMVSRNKASSAPAEEYGPRASSPSLSNPPSSPTLLPCLMPKANSSGQGEGAAGEMAGTTGSSSQVSIQPSSPPQKKAAYSESGPGASTLEASTTQQQGTCQRERKFLDQPAIHDDHKVMEQPKEQEQVTASSKKPVKKQDDLGPAQRDVVSGTQASSVSRNNQDVKLQRLPPLCRWGNSCAYIKTSCWCRHPHAAT